MSDAGTEAIDLQRPGGRPATAAPAVRKTAPATAPQNAHDGEDAPFSSLGLPFYFRHAQNAAPSIYTGVFVLTALWLLGNLLCMPYARDTLIGSIRRVLPPDFPAYKSFEEGGIWIFNQGFVFAIVISTVLAPLFATFSMSTERVTGTIEFLQLSPMPTCAIVMGKMFAPAHRAYIASAVALAVASVIGWCSGLHGSDIGMALLSIILFTPVIHAVGAASAAITTASRGFMSGMGLIALGSIFAVAPVGAAYLALPPTQFISFLSPWGAMAHLFWRDDSPPMIGPVQFAGSTGAVVPYVIVANALAFALLLWAACRKMDKPERPALPVLGWLAAFGFVLATAFGSFPHQTGAALVLLGWLGVVLILFFGGYGVCVLAALDYPFHRDTVLVEECERAAGRKEIRRGLFWQFRHAFLISALVAIVSGILAIAFQLLLPAIPVSIGPALLMQIPLAFLSMVRLETAVIGYADPGKRSIVGAASAALISAVLWAPPFHIETTHAKWSEAVLAGSRYFKSRVGRKPDVKALTEWEEARKDPDLAVFLDGIDSSEAADARFVQYNHAHIALFMRYHPFASVIYVGLIALAIVLPFVLRRRAYAALRREAERAVRGGPVSPRLGMA